MTVETSDLGPYHVATIRHIGPYTNAGRIFDELWKWVVANDLVTDDTIVIGLSYDDPAMIPAEQLRYDACVTVPQGTTGTDRIVVRTLPLQRYAHTIHVGSYEGLGAAFGRMFDEWLHGSGAHALPLPCIEIYLDDMAKIPMEQLRTLIGIPVV